MQRHEIGHISRTHHLCQLTGRLCTEALKKYTSRLIIAPLLVLNIWYIEKTTTTSYARTIVATDVLIMALSVPSAYKAEVAFSTVEKKRLYVCLNLFSGPQIIYCQHTLHHSICISFYRKNPFRDILTICILLKDYSVKNLILLFCSVIQYGMLNAIMDHYILFSKRCLELQIETYIYLIIAFAMLM